MAEVAEQFPAKPSNAGLYYAIHYFGWHWRITGDTGRCPPPAAAYEKLAPRLEQAGWPSLQDERFDLQLIERLPPSKYMSNRLAALAFNSYPLTNGPLSYDNRPFARILLAEQGDFAAGWKNKALREIAPNTKLGTSAAYLAVSLAPKEALPRVSEAITKMTALALSRQARNSGGEGIGIRDGFRLYELAYAMSMAGPAAEPYSSPLISLLDRKFAAGSHFGLLMLDPISLCDVARQIGGRALTAAKRKPFCVEHFEKSLGTQSSNS